MFQPKKIIPRAAIAALALGGCNDEPADELRSAATAVCRKALQCSPDDFHESFRTVRQCSDYYTGYLLLYYSADRECAHAMADLLRCMSRQSCDALYDEYGTDVCPEEYAALYEVCDYSYDYGYGG